MATANRTTPYPTLARKARHRAERQPAALSQAAWRILTEILPCACKSQRCRLIWAARTLGITAALALDLYIAHKFGAI
jgi:hypothetical protein